jgi:GntR family transcriptional repressor for pyruvate dehydrogenase complex
MTAAPIRAQRSSSPTAATVPGKAAPTPSAPRRSEAAHLALAERIRSGVLPPGARLPTEKDLGAEFGISRPLVREAVARLKADGLVISRQGAGVFVAATPSRLAFDVPPDPDRARARKSLAHIFELRTLVEIGVAELAARRRRPKDLKTMGAALARMAAAVDAKGDGGRDDDAFHGAVAAATGNPMMRDLVGFLSKQFSESRRLSWTSEQHDGGRTRLLQHEHQALFDAIAAGDPAAARAASYQHLAASAARLGIPLGGDVATDLAAALVATAPPTAASAR